MRACAINPFFGSEAPQPHLSDHLAAICHLLDIPLIVTDFEHFRFLLSHYPDLPVDLVETSELTPAYYLENYDVIFRSLIWDMRIVHEKLRLIEAHYGKPLRTVHCPHGLSDKTYWFEKMAHEDIILSYGPGMKHMYEKSGVLDSVTGCITTGNLRLDYYRNKQAFFDAKAEEDVFSRFSKKQKVILYAPTWYDGQEASSFFQVAPILLKNLPENLNLLIKLHPRTIDHAPEALRDLEERYQAKENVIFLHDYPYIYPLLSRCDLYLGDMSSIGYDFLAFRRPMFFLNEKAWDPDTDPRTKLFRCGTVLSQEQYGKLFSYLDKALCDHPYQLVETQSQMYRQNFSKSIERDEFERQLQHYLSLPVPG